mgnify:CR=1 FL=1
MEKYYILIIDILTISKANQQSSKYKLSMKSNLINSYHVFIEFIPINKQYRPKLINR